MRKTLCLLAVLGSACKGASVRNPVSIEESGIDALERVEVTVRDQPAASASEAAWRELDPRRIFEPGVLILGPEATEFMERLRTNSATSFSGAWIDEGALLPAPETERRVVLRRVLDCANPAELRRLVKGTDVEEDVARGTQPSGRCELVLAELGFTLVPSRDRRACRVVLESIHARRDTARVLRMLQHEDSIELVVAFILRSVTDEVADGADWRAGRQESDWFPPGPEAAPWSVRVTIFDREEVRDLVEQLGKAAGAALEIAAKAKKAGVL
jgi:hypothetical protein